MNTVLTPYETEDGDVMFDMDDGLAQTVIASLAKNNAFFPNIDHVVFNTKTTDTVTAKDENGEVKYGSDGKALRETVELENPILTTVVYFVDGTKVTVKNSDKDPIRLVDEKVKLSDGTETVVRTASHESKEMGLVYAIVKRVVCDFDEDGNVMNAGFANFLHGVLSSARVQDVETARLSAERKINKARARKNQESAKAKKEPSPGKKPFKDILGELASAVQGLAKLVQKQKDSENGASAD